MSERSIYYKLKIEDLNKEDNLSFNYSKSLASRQTIKKTDGEVVLDVTSINADNTGLIVYCSMPITLKINTSPLKINDVFFASLNSDDITALSIEADSSLLDTDEVDVEVYLYSL